MKKTFIIFLCITIMLLITNCTKHEELHTINIIFPSARHLSQPDTLDVYNGDGVLIESFSTKEKCAYQIQYNELEYEEVITIYSHTLDKTESFLTIKSYDDDARGVGEWPMNAEEKSQFDILMNIDYVTGEMKADWGGFEEYEEWKNGGFTLKYKLLNSHLLKNKSFSIALQVTFTSDEENYVTHYIFDTKYDDITTEREMFLPKTPVINNNYEIKFILSVNNVKLANETIPVDENSNLEITRDIANYIK